MRSCDICRSQWIGQPPPENLNVIDHEEARVRIRSRVLTALVVGVAIVVGSVAVPAPAAADPPWIIPPGGWCYNDWYYLQANNGEVHQQYGPVKFFQNGTSVPVNWSESIQVNTTFSSTYSSTTSFKGGFNLGIISAETQRNVTVTIVWTISVNKTTGFQVTVPPGKTFYAKYGPRGMSTSGTYGQEEYECGTGNYSTVTTGPVDGFSLFAEGWHLWEA